MRRIWIALAVLAACGGDDEARVQILLEVPAGDGGGALLSDLDALEFRVSDGQDFRASRLYPLEDGLPDQLSLSDVPTGGDILFHLSGFASNAEVGYGRTCRVSVDEGDEPINVTMPPQQPPPNPVNLQFPGGFPGQFPNGVPQNLPATATQPGPITSPRPGALPAPPMPLGMPNPYQPGQIIRPNQPGGGGRGGPGGV